MSCESSSANDQPKRGPARKILAFHKIQNSLSFGVTNYSPRRLAGLLRHLKGRKYCLGSIGDDDADSLAITFDDGYQHLADHLPQLIEEFGIRPAVFVPTAYIDKNNNWDYSYLFQRCQHLDGPSIKRLADLGVEFGSHGHSHQALTKLSDEQLGDELVRSRKILEDITGRQVRLLSYPFGRCDKRVMTAARSAGYEHAFTMKFPDPGDCALATGRYAIYSYDCHFTIRQKLSGGRLYRLEQAKASFTNRLSAGTAFYRFFSGKRVQ